MDALGGMPVPLKCAPGPAGVPAPTRMGSTTIALGWAPPESSGGSGIVGYRIEVRASGDGEFDALVAHTCDPEPRYEIADLHPITWYEFRIAAINGVGTGPPGTTSEPLLTRALGGENVGGERRRRTRQAAVLCDAEREAHAAAAEREAALSREVGASIAAMSEWARVFEVRVRAAAALLCRVPPAGTTRTPTRAYACAASGAHGPTADGRGPHQLGGTRAGGQQRARTAAPDGRGRDPHA